MKSDGQHRNIWSILLKYVVPLVISVGLCWLLFHDFDLKDMMRLIRTECRPGWIVAGLGVTVCSHVFRALRWQLQLNALGVRAPLGALVLSIFGTYAVNLVFPRLGEVWRCGYIADRQDASFTAVLGSMMCERLADTATVLLLTLLAFALASEQVMGFIRDNAGTYAGMADTLTSPWLWLGAAACLAAVWVLLSRPTTNPTLQRLQRACRELWQGFIVIGRMPGLGRWLLYTVGIWGCFFGAMFLEFFSFGFTANVYTHYGLTAVLVTFVLSSISMGVPSNGGIGPWQWAVIFALGVYGLGSVPAGAFANLVLGASTLLNIALGIITFTLIAIGRRHRAASDKKILKQNQDKCQK